MHVFSITLVEIFYIDSYILQNPNHLQLFNYHLSYIRVYSLLVKYITFFLNRSYSPPTEKKNRKKEKWQRWVDGILIFFKSKLNRLDCVPDTCRRISSSGQKKMLLRSDYLWTTKFLKEYFSLWSGISIVQVSH